MTVTVKQDDGTEVIAFTQAEVDAKVAEIKAQGGDPVKVQELQTLLSQKEAEITGLKSKDQNFAQANQLISKLEGEVGVLKSSIQTEIQKAVAPLVTDYKAELVQKFSAGNKELADKIALELGTLNLPESSRTEIAAKVEKAFVLATGTKVPDVLRAAAGSSGAYSAPKPNQGSEIPDGARGAATALGISPDEFKKAQEKLHGTQ